MFVDAHLVGIGFGVKETHGKLTGDLAVRVYVTQKLPKTRLSRRYHIPEAVNGVATDVIPVRQLQFHSRPAALGAAISHRHGSSGSLGCIVTRPGDSAWYLLSASHVLAPPGKARVGDQILEPAAAQGGTVPIAHVSDVAPLKTDGVPNLIDAALARVIRKTDVALQLPRIGRLHKNVLEPVLYASVRKYGAGTLHTLGIVTDIAAEVPFVLNGEEYLFHKVLQITGCGSHFSDGGDSGALVVDALSNRPIGTVIGGAGVRTYVTPIERILKHFNAQIAE
jgi:hypothetical protein